MDCRRAQLLCAFVAASRVDVNVTQFSDKQAVKVSWQGVEEPTAADAIALFVPAHPDLTQTVPLKYKWASTSTGYAETGSGSAEFLLLNQRQEAVFLLFSNITRHGNFSPADVIASSAPLQPANSNEPTQGHLALINTPGEMAIQWVSRDAGKPTVWWGSARGQLIHQAAGSHSTYTRSDMCGAPASTTGWLDPGTMNYAVMSGLQPSRRYFYAYGDEQLGRSSEHSFMTGPAVGADSTIGVLVNADMGHAEVDGSYEWEFDRNTRLVTPVGSPANIYSSIQNVLGDNGLEQGDSLDVTQRMTDSLADNHVVFMNGDLSYARGFGTQWDVLLAQVEELARQLPVMVVEGNHERDWPQSDDRFLDSAWDSGGECGVPTYQRFKMPAAAYGQLWYSFDMGPVHFLQISTEVDFAAGSPQNRFIQRDLAGVNRSVTPWIVVNLHRPIYTSSMFGRDQQSDIVVGADLRSALEDLFFTYQVDFTLAGHVHLYERSCPVYKKTCMPANVDGSAGGTVHAVVGNAGQWLSYLVQPDTPHYMDVIAIEHGYMRYTANATALHAQMIASKDGHIMDDFLLQKPLNWRPDPQGRAAAISSFTPHPPSSWLDTIGISFGILNPIEDLCLRVMAEDPARYVGLSNASIVQNMNGRESLAGVVEVLQPIVDLLHSPSVYDAPELSLEAREAIKVAFRPMFDILVENVSQNRSGEIFRRQSPPRQWPLQPALEPRAQLR